MQALRVRELYCPSHFGNSYQVAGPQEMRAILSEARYWGFNRYSDWFDTIDLLNPYDKRDGHFDMPEAVWAQKLSHYATAAKLAMREADAAVRAETTWNEARLAAAGAFWAAKERLWRQVWGRGLGRAILKFDWLVPDWHAEYVQEISTVPPPGRRTAAAEA